MPKLEYTANQASSNNSSSSCALIHPKNPSKPPKYDVTMIHQCGVYRVVMQVREWGEGALPRALEQRWQGWLFIN